MMPFIPLEISITSLQGLQKWNAHPSKQKPVVIGWFFPYFFQLLEDGAEGTALEAFETLVTFVEVCEGCTQYAARQHCFLLTVHLALPSQQHTHLFNQLAMKVDWLARYIV